MMSDKKLEQLFDSITYKPDWTIRGERRFELSGRPLAIRISFWTVDVNNPLKKVEIAATHYYSGPYDPEYVIQFISDCIEGMENHERNEWFRVGGVQRVPTH